MEKLSHGRIAILFIIAQQKYKINKFMKIIQMFVHALIIAIFTMPCHAANGPVIEKVTNCKKNLMTCNQDLLAISKGTPGQDFELSMSIRDLVKVHVAHLENIQDLLEISSLVDKFENKQKINDIALARIKCISEEIGFSIETINGSLPFIKNQSLIDHVTKIRDELRAFKDLID